MMTFNPAYFFAFCVSLAGVALIVALRYQNRRERERATNLRAIADFHRQGLESERRRRETLAQFVQATSQIQ